MQLLFKIFFCGLMTICAVCNWFAQFWIQVPMKSAEDQCDDVIELGQGDGNAEMKDVWKHDTWHWLVSTCYQFCNLNVVNYVRMSFCLYGNRIIAITSFKIDDCFQFFCLFTQL